jgi:hypothetical protein
LWREHRVLEGRRTVPEGHWDEEFVVRPLLRGGSSALGAHGLVEGARSGQIKDF